MLQQNSMSRQILGREMFVFFKKAWLLIALLSVVGCQSIPSSGDGSIDEGWKSDRAFFNDAYQDHAALSHWRYSAKVGVSTPESKEYANMIWTFDPEQNNTVRLYGPLGIGAIKIEYNDQRVTLSDRKGVLHEGYSAERLLEQIVGWTIPVEALHYWVFSLPMPNREYQYQLNDEGQLSTLRQFGWDIDYSNYRDYKDGFAPFSRKVVAKKQVTDEQAVVVTLVTRGWQF